jgi:hypothetical protein
MALQSGGKKGKSKGGELVASDDATSVFGLKVRGPAWRGSPGACWAAQHAAQAAGQQGVPCAAGCCLTEHHMLHRYTAYD